jgi:hypothetical protein
LGSLTFEPTTGNSFTPMAMTTVSADTVAPGCPVDNASALTAVAKGPGAWSEGIAIVGYNTAALRTGNEMVFIPWEDTFGSYAMVNAAPLEVGRYDISLYCIDATGWDYSGEFTGSVWFTTTDSWESTDPSTQAAVTSTVLATNPLYRVDLPNAVTLTAVVSPENVSGTVQFMEELAGVPTPLGNPVPTTGGVAEMRVELPFGMYYFTAEFTPADPNRATSSVSSRVIYVVGKPEPPRRGNPATISGTARVGSTLTCSASFDGASSTTYSWLRDGKLISGATAQTWPVVAADAGHALSCRVAASNLGGTTTSTSATVKASG